MVHLGPGTPVHSEVPRGPGQRAAAPLDRADPAPLPAQVAAQLRALVLDRTLVRDDRLPGSGTLAAELGVSRAVVQRAYDQLVAEGWATARTGAGTRVTSVGHAPRVPTRPRPVRAVGDLVRLDTGTPFVDPRHRDGWRRAWREVSSSRPPHGYDDPRGLPSLREAIAERLARTRGLVVHPDEVMTTSGTTDALRHLLLALPAGAVAVEDPGYRAVVALARALGRPVLDLPPGRAPESLAGSLVVEDDYDSEFRWDVAPVPAMAALDRERVAYVGTASKSVAPSLRLGWLVAPPEVHERVATLRDVTHDAVPSTRSRPRRGHRTRPPGCTTPSGFPPSGRWPRPTPPALPGSPCPCSPTTAAPPRRPGSWSGSAAAPTPSSTGRWRPWWRGPRASAGARAADPPASP